MKPMQLAIAALALSAACAAHAQTASGNAQPAPQQAHGTQRAPQQPAQTPADCVGPASFCNIYFGS
ncbi:hypothetical protein AB4851_12340 [Burkholderia sp. 22PA0099]|uniref:hypothetical protein n=1 Tax=Burkholderia sp. 22PA0099 TaxID=3237372 RepID=UPI0039C3D648